MRSPLTIGAISPSSGDLARLITADLTGESAPVVELGGGTGVFTRAILETGVHPNQLTVFEPNTAFADLLEQRFPQVTVTRSSATHLIQENCPCPPVVGAVVSGLPILAMSRVKQVRVLVGAFRRLRPGAAFYQFTYAHFCPIPNNILARLGLQAEFVGVAHRN
ncbi:MAG: hypothetical protein KIT00_06530, partial [Rhodospirillales bacterium]|nr:hypothetical protein [Rhodospirillales bacterium]